MQVANGTGQGSEGVSVPCSLVPTLSRLVDNMFFILRERLPIRKKTGELPTSLPMGCTWATEWAARVLPMGILSCKLGCPLLPYMETVGSSVGSSVGSPLLPNMKKWTAQWAAEWAAHGNFAMQIRLPSTTMYGNSGQLSGQPTTSKHETSGQLSGQWSGLPMCCPWEFCHAN